MFCGDCYFLFRTSYISPEKYLSRKSINQANRKEKRTLLSTPVQSLYQEGANSQNYAELSSEADWLASNGENFSK